MKKLINALSSIRVELQEMKLKKSGKHKLYNFYELNDFLPQINALEKKYGVSTIIQYMPCDMVEMYMYDEEGNVFKVASCNTAQAKLAGGASPIQEKGAEITYIRRYLYMMAYAIVENDWVDCVTERVEIITSDKRQELYKLAGIKGYGKATIDKQCKTKYGNELPYISIEQYNEVYEGYKTLKDKETK